MKALLRWIIVRLPHPEYGNFGGRNNSKQELYPIDRLDYCFWLHDYELGQADTPRQIAETDRRLFRRLLRTRTYGWYMTGYKVGCLLVFGLLQFL